MISLTSNAIRTIRTTMEQQHKAGLRVGLQGGGCSGLSYVVRYEAAPPRATDNVFEQDGAKLFVDPKSYPLLDGMVLDYRETLMERGFTFENPNAAKSCGCGTSFTPKE
jgi:iron-sulfur cluster assembly protein